MNALKKRIESTATQLGITLLRHSAHELGASDPPVGQLDKTLSLQPPVVLSATRGTCTVFGAASLTVRPPALQRAESLQTAEASVPTSAVVANNGGLELIASPSPMRASIGSPEAHFEYGTASVIATARTVMREFGGHLDESPYDTLSGGVRASLQTELEARIAELDTKVASASDLLIRSADDADAILQLSREFGGAAQSLDEELEDLGERVEQTFSSAATGAGHEGRPRHPKHKEQLQQRQRETQRLRSQMDAAERRLEAVESHGSTLNTKLLERVTPSGNQSDSGTPRSTFVEAQMEKARSRVGELREQLEAGADQTSRLVAADFDRSSGALESEVERTRGRVESLLAETAAASSSLSSLRALRTQLAVEANETLPALEGALEALERGALMALFVAFSIDRPEHLLESLRTSDALPLAAVPSPVREYVEKTRVFAANIVELQNSVQTGIAELEERERKLQEAADSRTALLLRSFESTRKSVEEQSQALDRLREEPLQSPLLASIERRRDALQVLVASTEGFKQQLAEAARTLDHLKLEFEASDIGERFAAALEEQTNTEKALRAFEEVAARETLALDELLDHCSSFDEATLSVSEQLTFLEEELSDRVNPQQIEGLLHTADQLGTEAIPKCAALGSELKSHLSERDAVSSLEVDQQLSSLSDRHQQIAERTKALSDERAALLEEYVAAESQLTDLEERIRFEQDTLDEENLEASRRSAESCAADTTATCEKLVGLIARLFDDSNGAEALAERERLEARRSALHNLLDEWRVDIESVERAAREREAVADEFSRLAAQLDAYLHESEERMSAFDSHDDSLQSEPIDAHLRLLETLGAEIESRARPLLEQLYALLSDRASDELLAQQLADVEERLGSLSATRDSKFAQFKDLRATLHECLSELDALKELLSRSDEQLKRHVEQLGDKSDSISQKSLDSLLSALEVLIDAH